MKQNSVSEKVKVPLTIVKIGGGIIEDDRALKVFLTNFVAIKGAKILVHGGGKSATKLAIKLGIKTTMVAGRRVTDAEALKVITMMYAGLTNKTIVAALQKLDCNAVGLSGADGNMIQAKKRVIKDIDYGFVGDVSSVNTNLINTFLNAECTPVFCALTHDKNGQLLNTNADTIASEIAIAMGALYNTTLYYCFEKKGVLLDITDDSSVIKHIQSKNYKELLDTNAIADGMLPKLENCFYALNKNVQKVCIGDASMLLSKSVLFTTITL